MNKNHVYEAPQAECLWIVMEQTILSGEKAMVEDTTPVDGLWD